MRESAPGRIINTKTDQPFTYDDACVQRGVTIGYGVFIGMDALIETSSPELIEIGDRVAIGIRVTIIGHFRGHSRSDTGETPRATMRTAGVRIEDDAFIGPSVTILPNVTIGRGAVVTAGSVVARSVPPLTMVQGNPAKPIAKCGVPLGMGTPIKEFYKHLTPV